MINVTKTYLPPFEEYAQVLKEAYEAGWVTNNGKLLQRLEKDLKESLGIEQLFVCANGTVTLQLALKALDVSGDVITTPFSYVATSNAILWEKCNPVFADIDSHTFCIDPDKIEPLITSNTTAILATHVYGMPCAVERIAEIASKYRLPVIYDAAHAFGAKYKGKSLLEFGDISSCSFHATKIFHTIEGGCIVANDFEIARKIYLLRQFGHEYDEYYSAGINAKNSEFHAAMGLCLLPKVSSFIQRRKELTNLYNELLVDDRVQLLNYPPELEPNYSYYPVLFSTEESLLSVKSGLEKQGIFPRRYFYPSLNELPYVRYQSCPISEDISRRVLCLPLYYELKEEELRLISKIVLQNL